MKALAPVLGLLMACPVAAQDRCGPRDLVTANLLAKYGETQAGAGLQSVELMFEVWANTETGTWTILRTGADGLTCLMVSGTNWREGVKVPAGVPG